MPLSVTNCIGRTISVGDRVTHFVGWTGIVTGIKEGPKNAPLLIVEPDDLSKVPGRDWWKLNDAQVAHCGKTHFIRSRDHGLTMGNFLEAAGME